MNCNKPCVANLCGQCAVEKCRGPLTSSIRPTADKALAAKRYEIFMSEFIRTWGADLEMEAEHED